MLPERPGHPDSGDRGGDPARARRPAGHADDGPADGERLQKVLARVGLGSRRACEELIADGRVTVDGRPAQLGQRVDPTTDRIAVDGVPVAVSPDLVHYLLNKPVGVLCTAEDPQGRPRAVDLVPAEPRVFTVGRLDADSEGLLVLTNDGELAQRLTHPSFGIEKEYLVEVEGRPSAQALRQLRTGVLLDDGMTAPARVGVVGPGVLRVTIHEGRNRQVRRMCEAVGHPVHRLVRVRIGPVVDARLRPGEWRRLQPAEVRAMAQAAVARPPSGRAPSSAEPRDGEADGRVPPGAPDRRRRARQ